MAAVMIRLRLTNGPLATSKSVDITRAKGMGRWVRVVALNVLDCWCTVVGHWRTARTTRCCDGDCGVAE